MEFTVPTIYTRMLESPHILIAGTTGSGKSVALNSLLYSAMLEAVESGKEAKFTYVDLKMIELVDWRDLPNCERYVDRPEDAPKALKNAVEAMYDRYRTMQRLRLKESTEGHVYIVVDELADFVNDKGCLESLVTLGRLGRAAHYHLILCTQDPSRATLSAALLQNMTCRVALRTKSPIESRQIVGVAGAEKLPVHGKALMDMDGAVETIDVPMVPSENIRALISALGTVERKAPKDTKVVTLVPMPAYLRRSWRENVVHEPGLSEVDILKAQVADLKKANASLEEYVKELKRELAARRRYG